MPKVLVHEFLMGDNEDPEIYAAEPIYNWQQSDSGRWVMEHSCPEPSWTVSLDHNIYGYKVRIVANLTDEQRTFFQLKYGHGQ